MEPVCPLFWGFVRTKNRSFAIKTQPLGSHCCGHKNDNQVEGPTPNENQVLVLQDVHGALPRADRTFLGKDGVLLNFQKDVGIRNILWTAMVYGLCPLVFFPLSVWWFVELRDDRWLVRVTCPCYLVHQRTLKKPLWYWPACLLYHPSQPYQKIHRISISRYVFLIFLKWQPKQS